MDKEQKLKLVYGYIRVQVSFLAIPVDVTNLVDRFLTFSDKWNKPYSSNQIIINAEDNSITIKDTVRRAGLGRSCAAYGESVIDSISGIQSWKLRFTHCEQTAKPTWWFSIIGIARDDHEMLIKSTAKKSGTAWYLQRHSYGFVTG